MKNEMICAAMAQPKQNKAQKALSNVLSFGTAISAVAGTAATTVFALDLAGDSVGVAGKREFDRKNQSTRHKTPFGISEA